MGAVIDMADYGQLPPGEGGEQPPAPQPSAQPRPLCVTMDEMTGVKFDSSVFVTVLLTMFLPFPFVFRLFKCFEKSPGVMVEILHLALLIYPMIVYMTAVYLRQEDVDGVRWQSEIFFPWINYAIVSL